MKKIQDIKISKMINNFVNYYKSRYANKIEVKQYSNKIRLSTYSVCNIDDKIEIVDVYMNGQVKEVYCELASIDTLKRKLKYYFEFNFNK